MASSKVSAVIEVQVGPPSVGYTALWVRLNVKRNIGKCLPHHSFSWRSIISDQKIFEENIWFYFQDKFGFPLPFYGVWIISDKIQWQTIRMWEHQAKKITSNIWNIWKSCCKYLYISNSIFTMF